MQYVAIMWMKSETLAAFCEVLALLEKRQIPKRLALITKEGLYNIQLLSGWWLRPQATSHLKAYIDSVIQGNCQII